MRHISVGVVTERNEFYEKVSKLNNNTDTYYHCMERFKYGGCNERMLKADVFIVDAVSNYAEFIKRIPTSKLVVFIVPDDQPQLAEEDGVGAVVYSPYRTIDLARYINYLLGFKLAQPSTKAPTAITKTQSSKKDVPALPGARLGMGAELLTYEGDVRGFIRRALTFAGLLFDTHRVMFVCPKGSADSLWGVYDYIGYDKSCEAIELIPGDIGLLGLLADDGGVVLSDWIGIDGPSYDVIPYAGMFVPIASESGLVGYLIIGKRLNGVPYTESDVATIAGIAPYIAKTVVRIDKANTNFAYGSLLSSAIDKLPCGVLLCSGNQKVLAANRQFSDMAGLMDTSVIGIDVSALGSVLSDVVIRTTQHGVVHTRAPVRIKTSPEQHVVSSVEVGDYSMFVFEKQPT